MATSGSVNTNSYEGRYYQVSWTASQSVSDNTSTISWTLKAIGGESSWYAERTLQVVLAGSTVYSKSSRVERKVGTIASGTKTITHDSNGDASFSVSIKAAVYGTSVNCTGSKTFELTNIPRKSTLSVGNGPLGTAQTLTVTRKSSSFKHTIKATCGSASTTICTKSSSTSISFTPPLSWASQNTTGTSVTVKYTITTYNGDTSVGSNSYTKTCSIPSSVTPSCSISVSDAMGYESEFGNFIKGLSKFKIDVTAKKAYDSAIASYSTTANGSTYTSSSFTTDVVKSSGDLTIKSTVKDKRGRSGTTSVTKSVLDYSYPKISLLKVSRCNSDGSANDQGEYVKITFSCVVTALNDKNTASYVVKYKKTTESEYTVVELTDYNNAYSVTNATHIFAADSGSSYNIQLAVQDAFKTTTADTSASTGFTLINWLASGLGMAFGKVAELSNYLDIGFKTLFRDNVTLENDKHIRGKAPDGNDYSALMPVTASGDTSLGYGLYNAGLGATNLYGNEINFYTKTEDINLNGNDLNFNNNRRIYGKTSTGVEVEAFNPTNVSGNTVLGYGNYENESGNTNIYGYDINFGVSNIATPGSYKPYIRRGDSFNVNLRTSGFVTGSGKDVYFTIPLTRPILGQPTVSVASIDGFRFRQNNAYTHGCTSSTFVKPTSIIADGQYSMGVAVKATFSDTTNVVNNAPIGIDFYGTLTFS